MKQFIYIKKLLTLILISIWFFSMFWFFWNANAEQWDYSYYKVISWTTIDRWYAWDYFYYRKSDYQIYRINITQEPFVEEKLTSNLTSTTSLRLEFDTNIQIKWDYMYWYANNKFARININDWVLTDYYTIPWTYTAGIPIYIDDTYIYYWTGGKIMKKTIDTSDNVIEHLTCSNTSVTWEWNLDWVFLWRYNISWNTAFFRSNGSTCTQLTWYIPALVWYEIKDGYVYYNNEYKSWLWTYRKSITSSSSSPDELFSESSLYNTKEIVIKQFNDAYLYRIDWNENWVYYKKNSDKWTLNTWIFLFIYDQNSLNLSWNYKKIGNYIYHNKNPWTYTYILKFDVSDEKYNAENKLLSDNNKQWDIENLYNIGKHTKIWYIWNYFYYMKDYNVYRLNLLTIQEEQLTSIFNASNQLGINLQWIVWNTLYWYNNWKFVYFSIWDSDLTDLNIVLWTYTPGAISYIWNWYIYYTSSWLRKKEINNANAPTVASTCYTSAWYSAYDNGYFIWYDSWSSYKYFIKSNWISPAWSWGVCTKLTNTIWLNWWYIYKDWYIYYNATWWSYRKNINEDNTSLNPNWVLFWDPLSNWNTGWEKIIEVYDDWYLYWDYTSWYKWVFYKKFIDNNTLYWWTWNPWLFLFQDPYWDSYYWSSLFWDTYKIGDYIYIISNDFTWSNYGDNFIKRIYVWDSVYNQTTLKWYGAYSTTSSAWYYWYNLMDVLNIRKNWEDIYYINRTTLYKNNQPFITWLWGNIWMNTKDLNVWNLTTDLNYYEIDNEWYIYYKSNDWNIYKTTVAWWIWTIFINKSIADANWWSIIQKIENGMLIVWNKNSWYWLFWKLLTDTNPAWNLIGLTYVFFNEYAFSSDYFKKYIFKDDTYRITSITWTNCNPNTTLIAGCYQIKKWDNTLWYTEIYNNLLLADAKVKNDKIYLKKSWYNGLFNNLFTTTQIAYYWNSVDEIYTMDSNNPSNQQLFLSIKRWNQNYRNFSAINDYIITDTNLYYVNYDYWSNNLEDRRYKIYRKSLTDTDPYNKGNLIYEWNKTSLNFYLNSWSYDISTYQKNIKLNFIDNNIYFIDTYRYIMYNIDVSQYENEWLIIEQTLSWNFIYKFNLDKSLDSANTLDNTWILWRSVYWTKFDYVESIDNTIIRNIINDFLNQSDNIYNKYLILKKNNIFVVDKE